MQSHQVSTVSTCGIEKNFDALDYISSLDESVSLETFHKRLKFLECELLSTMSRYSLPSETQRLEMLNKFFFIEKAFRIIPAEKSQDMFFIVGSVLAEKTGSPTLISLLYKRFARALNLEVCILSSRTHSILKWKSLKGSVFLDLEKGGRSLEAGELVERLRGEYPRRFERLTEAELALQHLQEWASFLALEERLDQLLFVYTATIALFPNSITTLGRRALVNAKLGFKREALQDLKRYFSFADPQSCPSDLKDLFQKLRFELKDGLKLLP